MLRVMKLAALVATAVLLASPAPPPQAVSEPEGGPFVALPDSFATPAACAAHLGSLIKASAPPAFDRAVGPYTIADGDVRAHRVKAQGWGHDIEEFRCSGASLEGRRWSHSMSDVKPFTVEDIGKMSFPEG